MFYLCQSLTSELYSILLISCPSNIQYPTVSHFGGLAELENQWVLFSKWWKPISFFPANTSFPCSIVASHLIMSPVLLSGYYLQCTSWRGPLAPRVWPVLLQNRVLKLFSQEGLLFQRENHTLSSSSTRSSTGSTKLESKIEPLSLVLGYVLQLAIPPLLFF